MDDTRTRIIFAAMKAVRQYGLEGMRIQNVSDLAGVSPGALYRYFESKDQLILESFQYVDKQAAAIFEHLNDKSRDISYFGTFIGMVQLFKKVFPALDRMNQDLLWLHVLTSTVMYAKYVVEGILPDNQETEDTIFQLLTTGLNGYLKPEKSKNKRKK